MCKRDSLICRICLTTSKDDNISDASYYIESFIQLISKSDMKNLFLCMWCKAVLKRFVTLRKIALESEKILLLHKEMLADEYHQKPLHTLLITTITHTIISPQSTHSKYTQISALNEHNRINGDNIMKEDAENDINEVNMERGLHLNEVIIEDHNHSIDFFDEEIEFQNKASNLKYEVEFQHKRNRKQIKEENEIKVQVKNTNKKKMKHNKTEKLTKQNKIELKLDELKFEVKYLNLEEQLKEIENKKMKYKYMKFQCELCGIGFLTSDYLEEHQIKHTKAGGPHRCYVCSLHFRTRLVLAQHSLAHRRQFWCLLCGVRVSKWSNCIAHRQRCGAAVVLVECPYCDKVFGDEYSLKVHTRLHSIKKQYKCEHCSAQFTTKQRLIVHIRSHTGQKPFKCSQCEKCFTTNSNLRAHSAVHSAESRHYCVECNTHYKTAKSLKRHLSESVRHIRERQHVYSCKKCSKEFCSASTLACHVARHGVTPPATCPHCDKTFSNKSNLSKHLKCIHKNVALDVKSNDLSTLCHVKSACV